MKNKSIYYSVAVIMTIMLVDETPLQFITFIPHQLKYKIKTLTSERFATLQV